MVIKRRGISISHLNHAVFSGTGFMPPTWNVEDPPLEGWIEGKYMRPVTRVVVEEVKSGDWGISDKGYTTEDVIALAEGK